MGGQWRSGEAEKLIVEGEGEGGQGVKLENKGRTGIKAKKI